MSNVAGDILRENVMGLHRTILLGRSQYSGYSAMKFAYLVTSANNTKQGARLVFRRLGNQWWGHWWRLIIRRH